MAEHWADHIKPRLAALRLSPAREMEIVEELSQHLTERFQELRAAGTSEAEARRLSIEELLEPEALARHMRPLRQAHVPPPIAPGMPKRSFVFDLWQDLRYALRMLRKQPGFAAVAVLTLALGIGANSAIFALVDATVLQPLPFPDADRLVMISERTSRTERATVSPLNMLDWDSRNRTFDRIAAYFPSAGGMVMDGADGIAETVSRQWVTWGFFEVLGTQPIVGRGFNQEDETSRSPVVVLSEGLWRTRFGGDPTIVGRAIRFDGTPFTVVGVMPHAFQWPGRAAMWGLRPLQGLGSAMRAAYGMQAIGRRRADVSFEAAASDLSTVAEGLAQEFPATNKGRGVTVDPLRDALIGRDLRLTSMLFIGVVGFVLLICCANVANLLLVRATARTRELAIRSALGADRPRVVRQMLTESLVLSMLGGAAGLAVGAAILAAAPSFVPQNLLPPTVTVSFDGRVMAFCIGAALLVGLLFGLAPAWHSTKLPPAQSMTGESRTSTGASGALRSLLVVGEVATAVLLLFGAGLLLRTLMAVESYDRGYRAESALTMVVDPLDGRYLTANAMEGFFNTVAAEVSAAPGVRSAAWASTLPLGPSYAGSYQFEIQGNPLPDASEWPTADYQIVSASYFETLDLPIVAGRGFNATDVRDGVLVCMVNEAFVRRYLHGQDPIGQHMVLRQTATGQPGLREIVGVVRQVKERPDELEDLVQVYVPTTQRIIGDMFLIVRPVSGSAAALAPAVRAAIGRVDREQLVSVRDVTTLETIAAAATSRHRFRAVLVAMFAILALTLAMVGVSGILAYSVQQRVREFGVRRALGATTADVARLVAASALRPVLIGAVIGLGLSVMFGRVMTTMLFGVEPLDPATFGFVLLALLATGVVATAGPAWRAIRVDPAIALRGE